MNLQHNIAMTKIIRSLSQLLLTIFLLTSLWTLTTSLHVDASVGILPQGTNINDKNDRGWFVYQVAPGSITEDVVVLTNNSNSETVVELKGRDSEITSDGAFTVVSNSLENKSAGGWIRLDAEKYSIPAAQSIEVPFKIQVPQDASAGEYGAGLAVQEIGDEAGVQSGNVTIKTRNAVRMYIAVEGDLSLDSNVGSLNIIDPEDENFAIEKSKRSTLGRDNMVMQFQAQNTGNIFGVLSADYTIVFPGGEELKGTLKRDLAPGIPIKDYYIETQKPYNEGETKITFSYSVKPLNVLEGFAQGNLEGSLEDSLTLTQDQIDAFAPARNPLVVSPNNTSSTKGAISEEPEVKSDDDTENETRKLMITAIVFLVIILILQIANFFRSGKSSTKK